MLQRSAVAGQLAQVLVLVFIHGVTSSLHWTQLPLSSASTLVDGESDGLADGLADGEVEGLSDGEVEG